MSSPISKALFCALLFAALAGCGNDEGASRFAAAQKSDADGRVDCALAGSATFARVCSTEQITTNGTIMLVLRHPDGGFRRFNVLTNGRGLAAADGFDETRINVLDNNLIELSSGDDKYRLPAQIKNTPSANNGGIAEHAS